MIACNLIGRFWGLNANRAASREFKLHETKGRNMQCLANFYADLTKLKSDDEVAQALREFFSGQGEVSCACRFAVFEVGEARNFLIKFQRPADMIKVTSLYKLRSFGFDGVLVEVGRR